jgi:hypothetical protein
MGWDWGHKDPNEKVTDIIRKNYTWENDVEAVRVLDLAMVKLRTIYLACETTDKASGERKVWAGVALLGYAPKDPYYNFGYKAMDETVGPCEKECPERILDLLTPTDSEWANEWRAACRENLARRKAAPKLTDRCVVRFSSAFNFNDGAVLDTFYVRTGKGRPTFYDNENRWKQYLFGDYKQFAYELVEDAHAHAVND